MSVIYFYLPFIVMVVCVVGAFLASADGKQPAAAFVFWVVALLFCILTIFWTAPYHFGYGHIPNEVEAFSDRLENGIAYELIASSKDGEKNYVILVRKFRVPSYRAIRVEKLPPEVFTLIDGVPVAITAPAK